jgi:sugar lactone lactonase YvrE
VVGGFNAPNRVVLTRDARPGDRFQIAVFGINGPISASPRNYIWMRTATLDFYAPERARVAEEAQLEIERVDPRLGDLVARDTVLERVAGGFEFTEGPVWKDGALLFSSPNTNAIYRWTPEGAVTVYRSKSGYTGLDVGRYHQAGSNGLTFDSQGRLTMCQHGYRRILRVNPHGDTIVLADRYDGKRLNSPNDLVYRSDGTLFFTDPPFGLPEGFDDPERELPFSGVFSVSDGVVRLLTDELAGPNGIALSPDERFLYVGDWDPGHKAVMRYELDGAGMPIAAGGLLFSSPNTNAIYRLDPHAARVTVFRAKSGYAGTDIGRYHQPGSNGLAFSPDGLLTICQHGNRRVIRVNPHGDITVLADRYQDRRLNSPNDLVFRSDGTLYFTDPPFGLPGVFDDPAKELPFSGIFRARGGEVTLVTDELAGPNGIAFSPDEKYLYVGNWDPSAKVVMRYEIGADGHPAGAGEVLHDMPAAPGDDAIDGIKVDVEGNLYVCGPGGVWVLSPDGERLGVVQLPEAPHNLAWGDPDGRSLYVTALTSVYRIRLAVTGIRPL